jgi:hypothetical protein
VIVFNGEVYNWFELRDELKNRAHKFTTESDTEVVLAAYRQWGPECVQRFNGMWSMIIWDAIQQRVFVANDRIGIKQLYQWGDAQTWMLASEIKAIRTLPHGPKALDAATVDFFLRYGQIDLTTQTVLRDVQRFELNGGTVTDIKTGVQPFGIAVDHLAGKIYWADPNANTISRCNMDGSGTQVIISGAGEADYSRMIKLDLTNGKIYWTDANLGTVKRAFGAARNFLSFMSSLFDRLFQLFFTKKPIKVFWRKRTFYAPGKENAVCFETGDRF